VTNRSGFSGFLLLVGTESLSVGYVPFIWTMFIFSAT
jgi:hypothetical protein